MIYGIGFRGRIHALGDLLTALAGWVLVGPLTWIVPRRRQLILFFGRDGGKFIDNCKHLFATAHERVDLGTAPVFISRDREQRDQLRALGALAEVAGSPRCAWLWLRAGTICVDSIDWMRGMRFAGARGARVVQMWHGIPLKQVQIARTKARRKRPALLRYALALHLRITGRFTGTDWFVSTSEYVTETAFASSFRYKHVSHAGYPRNDALLRAGNGLAELGVDARAVAAVNQHRSLDSGGLVGMYAPTFRESMEDPFANGTINLTLLSEACFRLGILLLVKLHPWMNGRIQADELPGIVLVSPESDAYPLLRSVDFLITDYSSIFFDFLLLDRPVVFFPYDLESYLADERAMYYDYAAMTPGPKPTDLDGLIDELECLATGMDQWKAERARVRSLVFAHQDSRASDRLLDELFAGETV